MPRSEHDAEPQLGEAEARVRGSAEQTAAGTEHPAAKLQLEHAGPEYDF